MKKISPLKFNRPPKKTDVEPTSDRSKFSLGFAKALEQTIKDDLNGNVKSLKQTNKSLKDVLTNMEGRKNILLQDKQLMEGKFCTLNDKCKSLEQSNQFLTDNLSKVSTEFTTFKQEIDKRNSYMEKVTEVSEQSYIDNENVSKIITQEEHEVSDNIKQDTKFDMVVFMDLNMGYIKMSKLVSGRNNKCQYLVSLQLKLKKL